MLAGFKPGIAGCGMALILAGSAGACGGKHATKDALTVPEFKAKVVAICKVNSAGHEKVDKEVPKDLMKVEPPDFTAAQAKEAVPFFVESRDVIQKTADSIAALAAPAELKADVATALRHVNAGIAHLDKAIDAMKSGDLTTMAVEQKATDAEFENADMKRVGKTTGLSACG